MDVLAGTSVDALKVWIWVMAIAIGVVVFFINLRANPKRQVWAAVKGVFSAACAFVGGSLGAMLYIMFHFTDPRWSEGKTPLFNPDDISSGGIFPGLIDAFNNTQNTIADAVNKAIAIDNTFRTMSEYIPMLLWGAGVAIMLRIVMVVMAARQRKWLEQQAKQEEQKRKLQAEKDEQEKKHIVAALHELQRKNRIDPWPDL